MKKNGSTFVTIQTPDNITSGIWNPYNYKYSKDDDLLPFSDYAEILKVNGKKAEIKYFDYIPIEYKHIPKGDFLTFSLKEKLANMKGKYSFVEEETLLFGTMRAYLGNACITPIGKWLNKNKKIKFAINSEFVKIQPYDNLKYFWWAYIKSEMFLREMPTGSGGTRPRVSTDLLEKIRINVPSEKKRHKINNSIKSLTQNAWSNYIKSKDIFKNLQV